MLYLKYNKIITIDLENNYDIDEVYNVAFDEFANEHRSVIVSEAMRIFDKTEPINNEYHIAKIVFDIRTYDIMVNDNNIIGFLNDQIPYFIKSEKYEMCSKIQKYIEDIKVNTNNVTKSLNDLTC